MHGSGTGLDLSIGITEGLFVSMYGSNGPTEKSGISQSDILTVAVGIPVEIMYGVHVVLDY